MCLTNFKELKNIPESEAIIGYRVWKNPSDSIILKSEYMNYEWSFNEGPHEVLEKNSGIYAYNNYNYNYYNNYYNYNYNYYNYNYNYYNYYIQGIIKQWGKVAIHESGQRSEYAKIDSLFSIRESDAKGPKEFIEWIKIFNKHVNEIAKKYNAKVISWQDFLDSSNSAKK